MEIILTDFWKYPEKVIFKLFENETLKSSIVAHHDFIGKKGSKGYTNIGSYKHNSKEMLIINKIEVYYNDELITSMRLPDIHLYEEDRFSFLHSVIV